jgi:hypothetical protein
MIILDKNRLDGSKRRLAEGKTTVYQNSELPIFELSTFSVFGVR